MTTTSTDLRKEIETLRDGTLTRWAFYQVVMPYRKRLYEMNYVQLRAVKHKIQSMMGLDTPIIEKNRLIWDAIQSLHHKHIDEFTLDDVMDEMKLVRRRGTYRIPSRRVLFFTLCKMPYVKFIEVEHITENCHHIRVKVFRYQGE